MHPAPCICRYEAGLTFRWNVDDFGEEEPIRPEFYRHPATRHNRKGFYTRDAGFMPFGEAYAPYFPTEERWARVLKAALATASLMAIVAVGTIAIFALRLFIAQGRQVAAAIDLADVQVLGYEVSVPMLASLVASVLNTLFITLFNHIYRVVGVQLTDWENHRTDSEYESAPPPPEPRLQRSSSPPPDP